jgi:primosomal protein N' (replication factor Y)
VIGAGRTAEELGRAFPGFPVRTSGGERVLADVPPEPAVVVATPGAEPICPGGYGAALLLDGWALLSRPDLRAAEEALRRWANAAALVRPGGAVVVGAEAGLATVQALVRWDPAGAAQRELAAARLPEGAQVIGPVPVDGDTERVLVRVPRAAGAELGARLKEATAGRSARRSAEPVRIQLDPQELV